MKAKYISNKMTGQAFCLLLLLMCGTATAQEALLKPEYSYRRYTTADGLPSMKNERLLIDGKGILWIASTTGLTRFDGFDFKNYLNGKFANLYHLDKDAQGNVRAFTNYLMYSLDEKNDTLVCMELAGKGTNLTNHISACFPDGYGIYEHKDGSQALYKIGEKNMEKVFEHRILSGFPDNKRAAFDEKTETLYLPGEDSVFVVSGNYFKAYPLVANGLCLYNGIVWIVAQDGIYQIVNQSLVCILKTDVNPYQYPVFIRFDREGTMYFSNEDFLRRFKDNKIETVFSGSSIHDFIFDNENNLWVATYDGLYNLFRLNFRNYVLPGENDVVRSVAFLPDNNSIVAATLNGDVYEFSGENMRKISYPPSQYPAAFFQDHACVKGSALFLPGPGDVLKIDGNKKQWLNLPFSYTYNFVSSTADGNLLTGGANRLFLFTPAGKLIREFGSETVKQSVYAKPCTDKNGNLYLGGYSGVTHYDIAKDSAVVTFFDENKKIVKVMNTDNDKNVWFASENRLFRIEGGAALPEHSFDFLIQGIYFTRKNNTLIVATLGGIYISDNERGNYILYNYDNGYTGEEVTSASITEDADGNIYLPSLTGLFRFNPETLSGKQSKPNLQILSVKSSKNNIEWLPAPENRILGYKNKNLRFNFIGLSYSAAQNVRYRYRLYGFQNDWSEPVKNREVTFNNLSPGDYVFEIYADAGTDESRSEIRSFAFAIRPAFWQTAWFIAACAVFLILAGAGVALYVQHRRNRALLEKLRAEKELNELRISSIRLKAIPHFNANVLAAIEYYIANRTKEEAMRLLGVYSDFTFKTLSEVDKAARPLSEELAYVKMYLDLEKIRFLDKFDFSVEIEENVDKSVQLPNMILHTYCENAVKHGLMPLKSGGQLAIKVSQHGQTVCVSVEDNGVGRARAAENPQRHSAKQGLAILNRQIEIYNRFNREKIIRQVEDLAKGTRFTVEVPTEFTYIN
jgi:hypothetical protein